MLLTWLVVGAIGVMLLLPKTAAGQALRRLLVDKPAAALHRLRRGHLALVFLLAVMLAGALAMGREGFVVAGQTPEVVAWFAAFDIATYVDVFAAALLVAAAVRLKVVAAALRLGLERLRLARPRAARSARRPRRRPPPPDPEDAPWPAALAFAA